MSTGDGQGADGETAAAAEALREGVKDAVPLFLVENGLPIYAPVVQEYGVMTEDMVQEQQELLSRLVSDPAAAEMRAKLQIGSLECDMQVSNPIPNICYLSPHTSVSRYLLRGGCRMYAFLAPTDFRRLQAFKAANPGASLEDFVRWYSPRDWIEVDETGDSLKSRVPRRPSFLAPLLGR